MNEILKYENSKESFRVEFITLPCAINDNVELLDTSLRFKLLSLCAERNDHSFQMKATAQSDFVNMVPFAFG